jgi:hypothetical protein
MAAPFVWLDIAGEAALYRDLLAGNVGPGIGDYEAWITDGQQHWAGVIRADGPPAWEPYVPVANFDAAVEHGVALGGRVPRTKQEGPACSSVLVADPAGAVMALFVAAAE